MGEHRAVPQTSGYSEAGASLIRRALKGFTAPSYSPYQDIDWNNRTLRQRGRMLYMAAPVATSAINTNRSKIVGTGLTLNVGVDREKLHMTAESATEWQRNVEHEFRIWAGKKDNCDATGVNNFEGIQQLIVLSWLTSGDTFALIKRSPATPTQPYTLRLHLIEADRVSTPTSYGMNAHYRNTEGRNADNGNDIHDGVEVDKNGRIVAYHICDVYPGQSVSQPAKWTRVEAYGKNTGLPNVLHIMNAERPDQYRGVTYLAQVIEPLLNLNRYTQSEMMSALVQSFFSAWITTETDKTGIPFNEVGGADEEVSVNPNEHEMGPGTINHLSPGEGVTFGSPNIPTTGFESFTKTVCRMVGAALEIPYEVLMKEFNSSYSASRAALMEAWEAFRMRRKWLVDDFCQPVYEIWLAEAVALGRIKAPGFFNDPRVRAAWCGAHWIGPVQGHLDPVKEVKADTMAVSQGFKTREEVTREYGAGDWWDNVAKVKRENEALDDAAGNKTVDPEAPPEEPEEEQEK